jgi:hypothetical protein
MVVAHLMLTAGYLHKGSGVVHEGESAGLVNAQVEQAAEGRRKGLVTGKQRLVALESYWAEALGPSQQLRITRTSVTTHHVDPYTRTDVPGDMHMHARTCNLHTTHTHINAQEFTHLR